MHLTALAVLGLLVANLAACTNVLLPPSPEDMHVAVRIRTGYLREGPGRQHLILAQVPKGTMLRTQSRVRDGDWIQVAHEGQALWISAQDTDATLEELADLPITPPTILIMPTPLAPAPVSVNLTVTGVAVNVRTGPSTDFPVQTVVRQGDPLQGLGLNSEGNWIQVADPTGGTGPLWIYAPLTDWVEQPEVVLPIVAMPSLPQIPEPEPTQTAPQDLGVPCPLLWSDEFAEDGLPSTTDWWFDQRQNRWYPDAVFYTTANREANGRVENGHLIIEVHKEEFGGREFTVARLTSTQAWTYGWYEIAARLPEGGGVNSAIWMVSNSNPYGNWPGSGEIDIMEFVGYKPDTIQATVHTEAYNHRIGNHNVERMKFQDLSSAFHLYAMEWTESAIKIYVDDFHYFTFENERLQNGAADQRHWPFDHPFHFILSISVGGNWADLKGVDPDIWPQRMELDYIRLYACKP